MKCFSCPQPVHPSTGDYDAEWDVWRCETCYKAFLSWMRGHTARAWSGHKFYVEAETSIRPEVRLPFVQYVRLQGPMQQVVTKRTNKFTGVVTRNETATMVSDLWVPLHRLER